MQVITIFNIPTDGAKKDKSVITTIRTCIDQEYSHMCHVCYLFVHVSNQCMSWTADHAHFGTPYPGNP